MIPERQRQQFGVGQATLVRTELPNNPTVGERLVQGVMHVEDQSQLSQQRQWVGQMARATEKPNTKAAYEPKQVEFLEFCDEIYGSTATARHIDEDKVYRFLFYQTHHGKKKPGPKKKTRRLLVTLMRRNTTKSGTPDAVCLFRPMGTLLRIRCLKISQKTHLNGMYLTNTKRPSKNSTMTEANVK